MRRDVCGGCGSTNLDTVLDLGKTPPANTLPANPNDPEVFYPLQLGVCATCWLVQQMEIVPDADLYSADYAFYSSASLPKQQYHRDLARRLLRDHPAQARRLTVEVACNDGDLLRHFRDVGCRTLGVDPAAGPASQAANRGLTVQVSPFNAGLAGALRDKHGPAGLLIANHVVAHVVDLDDFFTGVDTILDSADGVAVVEVQYLMDLLVGNQLDHVYHEHRYHFSLSALAAVAGRHRLRVLDVRHTPAQSGSINVTLGRDGDGSAAVARMLDSERWLRHGSAYQSLQGRAEHIRHQLLGLLDDEVRAGHRIAGYAAPAKATTLLNWCGIGPDVLEYVVDTTPYKQGRFIPGVHVPIVGRQWDGAARDLYEPTQAAGRELPDTWLLNCWNYAADVLRREQAFTAGGGRWIIPIPVPTLF
jgi:hypothetical protein